MDALRRAVQAKKRGPPAPAPSSALTASGSAENAAKHVKLDAASSASSSSEDSSSSSEDEDDVVAPSAPAASTIAAPSQESAPAPVADEPAAASTAKPQRDDVYARVLDWIHIVLDRWRAERVEGKLPRGDLYDDTLKDLKPLLVGLEKRTLSPQVAECLRRIVEECQRREYVRAGDEYIKLTIGNSAWPIGVTAVGIHVRAGRSRIEEGKVQHIMKDETARLYLTTFKRLMTKAQGYWPPEETSKMLG